MQCDGNYTVVELSLFLSTLLDTFCRQIKQASDDMKSVFKETLFFKSTGPKMPLLKTPISES